MWQVREAFFAIADCSVPVVGAIHGAALGTGVAIAASCDFVVAAEDARFGLPELTVGVMGGARHLARMAPQPLVRRMFFTGEPLSAKEFADAGGAIFVRGSGQFLAEASDWRRASLHSVPPQFALESGSSIASSGWTCERATSSSRPRAPPMSDRLS